MILYSESDLEGAVEAGAITREAAAALRQHVFSRTKMPAVDEEHFRLITGFNDIFVSIACLLVVFAAAAVGSTLRLTSASGLLVAMASWLMAEAFTRKRRMALPSIILLLTFVIALGHAGYSALEQTLQKHEVAHAFVSFAGKQERVISLVHYPWQTALITLGGAAAAGCGAVLHWRRFRVAITIAAAAGALAVFLIAFVAAMRNVGLEHDPLIAPAALICGLSVFVYAMKWDMSDRSRTTQRSDIAFWLHLVAAPLIAHPLFYWMGVTDENGISIITALGVLAIYLAFAVVALAIDRRALLVSALAYVLIAMAQLFSSYGAIKLNVALTALIIGSALLALSAWWHDIRLRLMSVLPEVICIRLANAR